MVAKHIVLHLGAHKTATTFVQACLSGQREALSAQGVGYIGLDELRACKPFFGFIRKFMGLLQPQPSMETLGDARVRARDLFRGLIEGFDEPTLLVSYESLLGFLSLSRHGNREGLYPHRNALLEVLSEFLEPHEVTVLYYVRRQDTYLESVYMQQVKEGHQTRSFDDFLAQVDIERLSWLEVIADIERYFGAGKVIVRAFEQLQLYGRQAYLEAFLGHLAEGLRIPLQNVERNASYSSTGYRIAMACNPFLSQDDRRKLRGFLSAKFSSASADDKPVLFNPMFRELLVERCEPDNRRVIEDYIGDRALLDAYRI